MLFIVEYGHANKEIRDHKNKSFEPVSSSVKSHQWLVKDGIRMRDNIPIANRKINYDDGDDNHDHLKVGEVKAQGLRRGDGIG